MDALRGTSQALLLCPALSCPSMTARLQHFQRHLVVAIVDCNTTHCERSVYHPRGCRATTCARVRYTRSPQRPC